MIASWWQAPGNAFSAFSHTGAVTDELPRDIRAALADRDPDTGAPMAGALLALAAYVGACTVSPYIVTHNAPGCLPDGDPYAHTLDYAHARQAWVDMMGEAAEILGGADDCMCAGFSDGAGTCPPCDVDAHARASVRDAAPPWDEPTGAGGWDHAVTLAPDDEPTHARVFVIGRTPMRAADFFAGIGDPLPTPDAAPAGTGATVAGAA